MPWPLISVFCYLGGLPLEGLHQHILNDLDQDDFPSLFKPETGRSGVGVRQWSSPWNHLAQRQHWTMSIGWFGLLVTSGRWRRGTMPNTLQCTAQLATENYRSQRWAVRKWPSFLDWRKLGRWQQALAPWMYFPFLCCPCRFFSPLCITSKAYLL